MQRLFQNQLTSTDSITIRDIFILYTMTLMEWLKKQMPVGQPNPQTMWTQIIAKSRSKAMFDLLLKIGLKIPLNQDFFKDFTKGRKSDFEAFSRFRIFTSLYFQKLSQLRRIQPALPQFISDLFTMQQINAATKQDMLKIHMMHFQDNYHMKILKIENSKNADLRRHYSNLLLQMAVALKLPTTLQQLLQLLFDLADDPQKYQTYVWKMRRKATQMMNIQQPEQQHSVSTVPTVNTIFNRLRQKDKSAFIEKRLSELFTNHNADDGKKLRNLIQNQIRQSNDQKGSYYCTLLAIKILFCTASDCQKTTFISQIQHDYSQITELAQPSLKSLRWLILALSYCSNNFGQQSLTEMINFVGKILSARKSNDKDFLCIVMIQGLMEARQDNHINGDFWKYLILENKPLFHYYGSHEAYNLILEMGIAIYARKNTQKTYVTQISYLKLTQLFQVKSQFTHQDNFTQTELLNICQTIIKITDKLQLNNQTHKVTAFKLQFITQQNADKLIRDICLYLSTYFYSHKVLVEKPPQLPDTRILFKILSILLWNSNRQPQAIVCLTLLDEPLQVQKLHNILSSRIVIIPQPLYAYLNGMTIFQMLVRISATLKDDTRIAILNRWICHGDNHLFNGQLRKRKVLFRKQIAFTSYLLQNM